MAGELPSPTPEHDVTTPPASIDAAETVPATLASLAETRAVAEAQHGVDREAVARDIMAQLSESTLAIERQRSVVATLARKYLGSEKNPAGALRKAAPIAASAFEEKRVAFEANLTKFDSALQRAKTAESGGQLKEAKAAFIEAQTLLEEAIQNLQPPAKGSTAANQEKFLPEEAARLLAEFRTEGLREATTLLEQFKTKVDTYSKYPDALVIAAPATEPPPAAEAEPPAPPVDPLVASREVFRNLEGHTPSDEIQILITKAQVFASDVPGWDWWNDDLTAGATQAVSALTTMKTEVDQGLLAIQQGLNQGQVLPAREAFGSLDRRASSRLDGIISQLQAIDAEAFKPLIQSIKTTQETIHAWCEQQRTILPEAPTTPPVTPAPAATETPPASPTDAASAAPEAETTETPEETKERETLESITSFATDAFEAAKKGDFISAGLAMLSAVFSLLYYDGDKISLATKCWETIKPLVEGDGELKETATEQVSVSTVFRTLGFSRASVYNGILSIPMTTVARYAQNPDDSSLDADQKAKLDQFSTHENAQDFFDLLLDPVDGDGGGNGGSKYATESSLADSPDTLKQFMSAQIKAKTWRMPPASEASD